MSVNLLLDTCILKNLVSKTEFGLHLSQLDFSVRNNHVKLLFPETLKLEWIKHKVIEKEAILSMFKSLEKDVRKLRILKDKSADLEQDNNEDSKAELLSQLEVIDDLLYNYGSHIETTSEVKVLVFNQRESNKRPFGDPKKDNTNDATIIFSALDYLQRNSEQELYFVSGNTGEFDAGIKPDISIHSDISVVFPTIKINYFTDIASAYQAFDILGIPRYKKEIVPNKIKNVIPIDKTKPVLDQLNEYFDKRSDQLIVIPKRILTEHYPIIIADTFALHHKPFTLVTDNKELFDLLSQVEVTKAPLDYINNPFIKNEGDEKKIRVIFKYMYLNNLTQVAFKEKDPVYIKYTSNEKQCDCPLCLYNRMNFSESLKCINTIDADKKEEDRIEFRIRDAYAPYKLGEFYSAAILFKKLYDERKDQKDIYTYIISFNLSHLGAILVHYYWDNKEVNEFGSELKQIDLEKIFRDCRTYLNKPLIEWIHEKKFFTDTFSRMHERVKLITDQFYDKNSGFNSNMSYLMEAYLSTGDFLNRNYIIYDIYPEFDSLTNLFTDGLLTSYGSSKFLSGKLQYLSDMILQKLMFAGKAEDIRKLYYRYKLDNIEYGPDDDDKNIFARTFVSALEDYPSLVTNYEKYVINKNDYFWDKYSEIVYNSLTLLGIAKFDATVINMVSEKLLPFLGQQKHIHNFQLLKHLRFFLFQKRKEFAPDILRKYFILALQNEFFHSDNYIETLVDVLNDRNIKISLTEAEFHNVNECFLSDAKLSAQTESWFSLGYIFNIITSEVHKSEVRDFVIKSLQIKMEYGKYYLANMFDIINPSEYFNKIYFEQIGQIVLKGPQKSFFDKRDYYFDSRIDNCFNFCLKYNLEIPATIKDHLPLMGGYYIWLDDMENFNYSDFNTDWLTAHFTLYYKRKYRQSNALKQYLLNLIKTEANKALERLFVLTYSFDD